MMCEVNSDYFSDRVLQTRNKGFARFLIGVETISDKISHTRRNTRDWKSSLGWYRKRSDGRN